MPDDPSQIIYVWIDALINYVAGLGFGQTDDWDEFEVFGGPDEFDGDDCIECEFEIPTFEELFKELGLENITSEDKAAMEKAYNEALKLEEKEEYEAAEKQWDAFFEMPPRQRPSRYRRAVRLDNAP